MPSSRNFDRPGFRHDEAERAGVLLVNLGTPLAPTAKALRRYLGEFLADPRVVELPRWLWRLILHGIVLRIRPRRSAAAYASIWRPEGSPLAVLSEALRARIADALALRPNSRLLLALAMRYGEPSIPRRLRELAEAGVRRLLVLPLYPQYSATTTASVFDAVAEELMRWRWLPELRFLTGYHQEPGYIEALAESVRPILADDPRKPSSVPSTGFPSATSAPATPTSATASAPRASSASAYHGPSNAFTWPFSRASGASRGFDPTPTSCSRTCRDAASAIWPCSVLVSRSIAWRRWRKLRSRAESASSPPAASAFATSLASTMAQATLRCSLR